MIRAGTEPKGGVDAARLANPGRNTSLTGPGGVLSIMARQSRCRDVALTRSLHCSPILGPIIRATAVPSRKTTNVGQYCGDSGYEG